MNFDAMSRAGAAGRITLIEAGAAMMGVPAGECRASNSQVIHTKTGKKVSYAKIVADGKASKVWTADELKAIKLKTPGQYTLVGQSVPQLDIPAKINGTAKYGIDAMVPGMLYGKPVRAAGALRRHGDGGRRSDGQEGQGLRQGGHARRQDRRRRRAGWWRWPRPTMAAKKAADALKITYDKGPYANVSDQTLIDEAKRLQKDDGSGQLFVKTGDRGRGDRGRGQGARGRVSHLHQHPRAARADECAGLREGRRVAHPHRQPVRHAAPAASPPARWASIPRTWCCTSTSSAAASAGVSMPTW